MLFYFCWATMLSILTLLIKILELDRITSTKTEFTLLILTIWLILEILTSLPPIPPFLKAQAHSTGILNFRVGLALRIINSTSEDSIWWKSQVLQFKMESYALTQPHLGTPSVFANSLPGLTKAQLCPPFLTLVETTWGIQQKLYSTLSQLILSRLWWYSGPIFLPVNLEK